MSSISNLKLLGEGLGSRAKGLSVLRQNCSSHGRAFSSAGSVASEIACPLKRDH